MQSPRRIGLSALLAALLWPAAARAGSFDAGGAFSFDPNAVTVETFDAPVVQGSGLTLEGGADALEGQGYASVSTSQSALSVAVKSPAVDASYRARMWARSNRVVADVVVAYGDGGAPGVSARMYPTGLVTSDGWYEVASSLFSIEGSRKPVVSLSLFASGADVDAFELIGEGTFRATVACSPPFDAACADDEFCAVGYCRNGGAYLPPLPPAEMRQSIADYFAGRLRIFFGGRHTRQDRLPIALATLAQVPHASSGWQFWNGIATAIRQLHDWHTTINGPVSLAGRGALPVCFVEGDADLSRAFAPSDPSYYDVLVSHVGPTANSGLKPGDRLVAVNGMHPIAFAESLEPIDWGMWRADDPNVHAEAVERMPSLIRRYAKSITIVRCDGVAGTCSPPETIDVTSLPADSSSIQYPYCDHRPLYHLGTASPDPVAHNSYAGPYHGLLQDSQAGENLYGMVWDDVGFFGSQNPYQDSLDEFRAKASGVILDHRLGNGGTANAASYLTSLFRTPKLLAAGSGFHLTEGLFDPPFSPSDGLPLFQFWAGTGEAYNVGDASAKVTGMPTALLLARDGSASDWFPFGMEGLTNVRLFGRRTAGAFSSFIEFDYFGGFSWRLASGDLLREDGSTHLGEGNLPSEEIVPKQSDLIVGKDTVYERALAWIRTCSGCK